MRNNGISNDGKSGKKKDGFSNKFIEKVVKQCFISFHSSLKLLGRRYKSYSSRSGSENRKKNDAKKNEHPKRPPPSSISQSLDTSHQMSSE